jgi:hypothetical protein
LRQIRCLSAPTLFARLRGAPGTGTGISMGGLAEKIQRLEKEVEDLKKRLAKLEK